MCKYGPWYFVGYKFLATCKKSERRRQRDDWTDRSQRTTTQHPGPIKQTKIIIVAENCFYAKPGSMAYSPHNFWH